SDQWERTMYITKLDNIKLVPIEPVDSILLSREGHFEYLFKPDTLGGLIYKLTLPPRGGNYRTSISGSGDNYLLITTEESDSLTIVAKSDSLYYSARISGGVINKQLLTLRDHGKPFFFMSRAFEDSISQHPEKADYFKNMLRPQWMSEIEEYKRKIALTL